MDHRAFPKDTLLIAEAIDCYGMDVAGEQYRFSPGSGRTGVLPKVARKLIEAGHASETPIRVMRKGTKVWHKDHPLSYWAGLTVSESDARIAHLRPFEPMTP